MANKHEKFQYEPLNRDEPSLRLLRLSPDSTGNIQYEMRHATIQATYTCLSYCWGDDQPTNRLLINAKEVYVRRNLFDFLAMNALRKRKLEKKMKPMWKKMLRIGQIPEDEWLWIDALCIDQNNHAEVNHQVQQMGNIYENAERVVVWLGKFDGPHTLREYFSFRDDLIYHPDRNEILARYMEYSQLNDYVYNNKYWGRAWIIQEIVLARCVFVRLNTEEVDLEMFRRQRPPFSPDSSFNVRFSGGTEDLRGADLIHLLQRFKTSQCSQPRDRIYCLLSLWEHGKDFEADYYLPEDELAVKALQHSKCKLCIYTAYCVMSSLRIHERQMSSDCAHVSPYYIEVDAYSTDVPFSTYYVRYFATDDLENNSVMFHPGIRRTDRTYPPVWMKKIHLYWCKSPAAGKSQAVWLQKISLSPNCGIEEPPREICVYGQGFQVLRKDKMTSDVTSDGERVARSRFTVRMSFAIFVKILKEHEEFFDYAQNIHSSDPELSDQKPSSLMKTRIGRDGQRILPAASQADF